MNIASLGSLPSTYQSATATSTGSSLAALSSALASRASPAGAGDTTTVTQLADGSAVATVRAPTAAIIAVTTTAAASPFANTSSASYAIDVTA